MEFNELKIFLTVAQKGSISRAAEKLHYVQSNVTARIKNLEERLGVTLFHRKSNGVTLTHSGHMLLDYAERILLLAKEAENVISNQVEPKGKLLIGSIETTAAIRLPSVLASYHRDFPMVDLNLITGPSEVSLKRLIDFQLDAALISGTIANDWVTAEKAFEEEVVLVAPFGVSSPDEVENFRILVFRAGCSYRAQLEGWLRKTGRIPYLVTEFGSLEGIIGCVAAGMGVSFLPRSFIDRPQYSEQCSLLSLPKEYSNVTTWFVRRKNEQPSKAMQVFMDLLLAGTSQAAT